MYFLYTTIFNNLQDTHMHMFQNFTNITDYLKKNSQITLCSFFQQHAYTNLFLNFSSAFFSCCYTLKNSARIFLLL